MPRIRAASLADHREAMRAALMDALLALLDEHDYTSISMGDLAARAGMARNTVYNHFPHQAALLEAVAERSSTALMQAMRAVMTSGGTPGEQIAEVLRVLLEAFVSGPDQKVLLLSLYGTPETQRGGSVLETLLDDVTNTVRRGVASGDFRELGEDRMVVEMMSGAVEVGVRRVIAGDPPQQVHRALVDLLLRGIGA